MHTVRGMKKYQPENLMEQLHFFLKYPEAFLIKLSHTKGTYLPHAASIVDFLLTGAQDDSATLDLFSL